MKKAYIILENGMIWEGNALGAVGTVRGDLIIETGIVGYLEALTAPKNKGKILLQTFPMIGNYGVISQDVTESATVIGYVVRECCDTPSNFRSEGCLADYLAEQNIVGIQGIDTRALTHLIRQKGSMRAILTDVPPVTGQAWAFDKTEVN